MMVKKGDARAYHYRGNNGSKPYWRDVGDLSAYWEAHMELIGYDNDILNFSPVAGLTHLPFSRKDIIRRVNIEDYTVFQSSIAHTAQIGNAVIKNSIVCPGVKVEDGVIINNSVLLDGAKVAAGVDISDSLVMPKTKVFSGGQGSIMMSRLF
jgi:glucose-1-phosphate adenylyltransferase